METNYIVENENGVFNFYLPTTETTVDGVEVVVKKFKFSKTADQINAEIQKLDEQITKKQEQFDICINNINSQKSKKQAILALMVA